MSIADVKNEWSFLHSPHTPSQRDAYAQE